MKTKILVSLVLSSILFSSSVSANAITAASDYIAEHPDRVAKAKEALKFGFKHAKSIPKGAAVVVAGKAAKTVVEHPFLTATGIAAYAWYSATSVDHAVELIARQPEALDNYLEQNPTKIDEFVSKAVDKYYENIDNNDGHLYVNLLDKMGIDIVGITIDYPSSSLKTKQDQDDLEKTAEFATEFAFVQKVANDYDKKNKVICNNIDDIKKIFTLTGKNFKKYTDSKNLTPINDGLPTPYNVDQYSELVAEDLTIERDHIPSYKALELFFLHKNETRKYIITQKRTKKKNPNSARYVYLANNATSINLPYNLHRNNRTTGDRNKYYSVEDALDSLSLRFATLKDYATLLVLKRNDILEYNQLKVSFINLYSRNKNLCLYDM